MSHRIPAKFKAELGELLANWYRNFGKVATRRAYHEDDQGGGDQGGTAAKPLFQEHPYLEQMPLGAPSDLEAIITNDAHTLEETNKRSEELIPELQNKLNLELGQKRKFLYEQFTKLRQ